MVQCSKMVRTKMVRTKMVRPPKMHQNRALSASENALFWCILVAVHQNSASDTHQDGARVAVAVVTIIYIFGLKCY